MGGYSYCNVTVFGNATDDGIAASTETKCGDGLLQRGEECDDPDREICSDACTIITECGDATRDGEISASDALTILRAAVDDDAPCATTRCDTDRNGVLTASDALHTLRWAVGIGVKSECEFTRGVVLRIEGDAVVGAIQLEVNFRRAVGAFQTMGGSRVSCRFLGGSLGAVNTQSNTRRIKAAIIDLDGIPGEMDLVECDVDATGRLSARDFKIRVLDASDTFTEPI
ncbi:MAG: hypothetical protein ACI8TX_003733, partial [Hyphomicrobiaceae bacterium]